MSSQGEEGTSMQTTDEENGVPSGASLPGYRYEVRERFSLHKEQRSDIPEIPAIPTNLMIPPSLVSSSTTSTVKTGGRQMTINISQETGTAFTDKKEGKQDVGEIHQNLDSIHSHVVREADVLQDLQSQLSIKAHEMERLRAEISQYERTEREALQRGQLSGYGTALTQTSDPRSGFSRTIAMPTIGSSTSDTDSIVREYKSKIEDLNTRLRMTTELCAKQDSYYRDIIKELEDRLTETVNGRDHILTLRDKEAANQMNLMKQLEGALRKQQHHSSVDSDEGLTSETDKEAANQMNLMKQLEGALRKQQHHSSEKEEVIVSLEEKLKYLESCHSQTLSIIDKLKHIVNEEEIKRGRPGIIQSQDAGNKEITSFTADIIVQTLQKCLIEDKNEKQSLNTKLEKLIRDHDEIEKELKARNEQLKQEYESKLEALKKDHTQALEIAESRSAQMKEELEDMRQKMDSIKKQHEEEVSSLVDQTKVLRLELTKMEKEKSDAVSECEKKYIYFQNTNNDAKVELKLLREEKEKLLLSLSEERASNISLKEKLENAEAERRTEKDRFVQISQENNMKEAKLKDEIEKIRTELEEYKTLLIQKEKDFHEQAEKNIENATKEEQEKANDRLNIILFELNKISKEAEQLKTALENKDEGLTKALEENNKLRYDLEKREQEMALLRQEKLDLAAKYEQNVKDAEQLQKDFESKTQYSDKITKDLNNANILIEKLKAQLDEREKTIASFRKQGTNLADILERNNVASDSLQREREELVQKVEEHIVEVQEMKKHREILAKKLKAKDKRVKELEEANGSLQKTVKLKNEELAAWTDERENVLSELKARRVEVVTLREERDSLNNLIEGKDGEREKEIGKLISRLKGSEQDLSLTKKLLKSKGEMSGKAVRVAETMQREVTEKRGEMDALFNKIHWLQENLNAAVQDKMYYESKSSRVSEELHEAILARDKLRFDVQQTREECSSYQKQVNHLEQALEKAAVKFAESQSIIEKLEQELARLKLKHSLELKEQERKLKGKSTLLKVDAATIAEMLARVNAGLRLPIVSSQTTVLQKTPVMAQPITLQNLASKSPQPQTQETPLKDNEVQQDLKCLLQDVRTLISSFQAHPTQSTIAPTPLKQIALPNTGDDRLSKKQGFKEDKRVRIAKPRTSKGHHHHVEEQEQSNGAEYQDTDREIQRLVNHDSEFDESFDMNQEYLEDMRPPLRSSSPKPESVISLATDRESYTSDPTIVDHGSGSNLNDSDVTSLLSFASTVSGETVDDQVFMKNNAQKSAMAPSVRSGQRSHKKSDKENIGTRRTGTRVNYKKASKRKDSSPPSYERAEMMLRSLAQTGNHLTKKNKEIARLLNEQDRRIKKCRDNEQGIQTLLT